jgi:hypothetical protein
MKNRFLTIMACLMITGGAITGCNSNNRNSADSENQDPETPGRTNPQPADTSSFQPGDSVSVDSATNTYNQNNF